MPSPIDSPAVRQALQETLRALLEERAQRQGVVESETRAIKGIDSKVDAIHTLLGTSPENTATFRIVTERKVPLPLALAQPSWGGFILSQLEGFAGGLTHQQLIGRMF